MAKHTPVGVANGNFRNRDYFFYAQALRNPYNQITERMMFKKKLRAAYWTQRLGVAMEMLKAADPNWEVWFDNDRNVPAEATDREMAQLVEVHVREIKGEYPKFKISIERDIFIWQDSLGAFVYSKEVGKRPIYPIEFETIEAARTFIRGLQFANCGYGFVLDLLPSPIMATSKVESE